MRMHLFIALLAALAHCYEYPPHANVSLHNDMLAGTLVPDECINRTRPAYENPVSCAEMGIVAVYPSVDRSISSGFPPRVLWRYAYSASDADRTVTDENGCRSYYHKTYQDEAFVHADLHVQFRNATYSEYNITDNPAQIPGREVLDQTRGDYINITLNGTITFRYMLDRTISVQVCTNGSCSCEERVFPSEEFNITRTFSETVSYLVEGGTVLHFLSKPVLREQWASNNEFEDMVFSNRRFHYASLRLNNETIGSLRLLSFNISENEHGAWSIRSYPQVDSANLSGFETVQNSTPVPLEEANDSFSYIYKFESAYDALGLHNITINLSDCFGSNFSRTYTVASRRLTYDGNKSEEGDEIVFDSSKYRPSLNAKDGHFSLIVLSSWAFGAIVLAFLLSRK